LTASQSRPSRKKLAQYKQKLLNYDSWQGQRDFLSIRHRVQTGSGVHVAPYPLGTGGSFPGGNAVGALSW